MMSLPELLRAHNWRTLRAIARAHDVRFDNRWTKAQAVDHIAALLGEPANVRRALAALPDDAHEALQSLLTCDGVMPAHRFLAHFGPLRPYRPWRADTPSAPWRHAVSPAERLWFLGLIFRCSTPEGEVVLIPDELRPFLPAISPVTFTHPAGPPLPTPDPVLDLAHLLAFLQGHDVRPFAGRWIAPRHLLVLNSALSYPDPAAIAARSELQTGYLRFLHYLAEAACLIAPVAGLLKPAAAAWGWLDLSEAQRWQLLWGGWQADLRRSPREAALWQRFRLPAERPFVCTLLDTLSALPGGGWMAPTVLAERLRGQCIGAGTLPRDGDILAPLQALLAGPLTWAGLVHTDPEGSFSFTPLGDWLLGRGAPPAPSPRVPIPHERQRRELTTSPVWPRGAAPWAADASGLCHFSAHSVPQRKKGVVRRLQYDALCISTDSGGNHRNLLLICLSSTPQPPCLAHTVGRLAPRPAELGVVGETVELP